MGTSLEVWLISIRLKDRIKERIPIIMTRKRNNSTLVVVRNRRIIIKMQKGKTITRNPRYTEIVILVNQSRGKLSVNL